MYVECQIQALYAECHYAERRYAECNGASLTFLSKDRAYPSEDPKPKIKVGAYPSGDFYENSLNGRLCCKLFVTDVTEK